MPYEKFDIFDVARKARNYLVSMVDERHHFLPYWFIQVNCAPAYARHVRVDDAELVASWYEAIVSVRHMIGADKQMKAVEEGFKWHLMRSWGPKGLRYHEDYPWSNTNHSSFHEMAYILGAFNRLCAEEPDNAEAEKRASKLVRGMRGLAVQRKTRTFWSGDFPITEKVYEFPGDIYLRDGGWAPERVTGRGEESIRNGMMLHSLVVRAEQFKDEVALDLAEGMANHLLGLSRYFNYRGEFFGHVHSAVWVASGLARLSRLLGKPWYAKKANEIFTYVRSLSAPFGWVPEYAQWHPMTEEHCETCCIKDMIQCALELIDCGYDYWEVPHTYLRNQLSEQQIKDGAFVSVDNSQPDSTDMTWKAMDKRVVGGWSGGGEPNSLSLSRFRSVAGCCVGTAPQALQLVWARIVTETPAGVYVNFPIETETKAAKVEIGYPNEGYVRVTARKAGDFYIRPYDWMGSRLSLTVGDKHVPVVYADNCVLVQGVSKGARITLSHRLDTVVRKERAMGGEFTASWRGPDVIAMDPPGLPLRLYQRNTEVPKEYPQPLAAAAPQAVKIAPTEQKK